ncbi:peptidylprolyl isomerase [Cryobacterium mesophilum]|uniref:peptidylprolyl isomerase n=1 Tax=Terrimesophilobacter mesophilus TaxID=433647 RepID=A0A4R8VEW0_9MICO|nr:FKBP-type peptidyl-prolyl cis-trans isomerase [Terrimesophilobacter mesophilus]MBB5634015.1 peptidylprolyl isomerase [Terrimesophilobacter mesophilus]TFB81365.1 hypothetical protein E3N84_00030 [Terrimesophilobacter mesophilus]
MLKVIPSITVGAMVALSLVACSSPGDTSCDATPPGSHSTSVTVSGKFGSEPKVTMPPAFDVSKTERSVLINGSGAPAQSGDAVDVHYTMYNASTGKQIELAPGTTWQEAKFVTNNAQKESLPGLYSSLLCSHEGDRVVSAIPSSELFGHTQTDMSGAGIGPTDTLVFIFDVSGVGPAPSPSPAPSTTPQPLPTPAAWETDVPKVDLGGDVPVVTLPKADAPTKLLLKVIKEGTGDVVTENSTVTFDYQGTSWNTGKIFDQSYTRGEPATFPVGQLVQGFTAAMVGQKVGATVLVSVPPVYGYGDGAINDQNLVGQTLVFLIQIRKSA